MVALRDRVADLAWTDQALLDLVCVVELAGRLDWLDERIR